MFFICLYDNKDYSYFGMYNNNILQSKNKVLSLKQNDEISK